MIFTKQPHFFRIIHPFFLTDGCVTIPHIFLREYGNSMTDFTVLRLPTGAEWRVELLKRHGEVLFSTGWQQFSEYYSIEHGHFLLFRYEGHSHFHVLIFDMTASEIEYPSHGHHHQVSVQILDDFPPTQTTKHRASSLAETVETETGFSPKSSPSVADAAVEMAKAFQAENPSVIVTMQPSYVGCRYNLCVPHRLFRSHVKMNDTKTTLLLHNGRSWPTKYSVRRNNVQFSSGWMKFAKDNCLKVGDICAFELINCSGLSLQVTIFRKVENASCSNQR